MDAQTLVRDMSQALMQAEQQLTEAHAQLQRTIPAQQEHRQLVRKLQLMQCACWNRSLSAELSGLILGKTSRYNAKTMAISCPVLRGNRQPVITRHNPSKMDAPYSQKREEKAINYQLLSTNY